MCNSMTNGELCEKLFNCCDCGGNSCGCRGCFSCNACEVCINSEEIWDNTQNKWVLTQKSNL